MGAQHTATSATRQDPDSNDTFDSVERLLSLAYNGDGSHQVRILLGYVQTGEIPIANHNDNGNA